MIVHKNIHGIIIFSPLTITKKNHTMKRLANTLFLLTVAGSLSLFSSCSSSDITFDFPVTVSGLTYGPDAAGHHNLVQQSVITSKLDSLLSVYGGSKDNISKVELKSLDLTITGPSGATFAPFYFADAKVFSAGDTVKIAYSDGAVGSGTTASLQSQYSDVAPIVKEPSFTFQASVFDSLGVSTQDTITANIVFSVSTKKN